MPYVVPTGKQPGLRIGGNVRRGNWELRLALAGDTMLGRGVAGSVLYDLGDFLDDYATHPLLRKDLGLLFVVTLDERGLKRVEPVPLALDYCYTRAAVGTTRHD